MSKEQIIREVFGKVMANFDYNEFEKTHPKMLKAIHSAMEVASMQGQLSQMPSIGKEGLKRRMDFKN